jgi:tetratricopeptide (TPR) repeat protein
MYSRRYLLRLWLDIGDAEQAHHQADSVKKSVKTLKSEFEDMWLEVNVAYLKLREGLHDSAMKHIRKGLAAAKDMDCLEAHIEALLIAGKAELAKTHTTKAKDHASDALQLAIKKKRKSDMAHAYLLLAKIYQSEHDTKEAEKNATESKKISETCGIKEITWTAHYLLGKIHQENKRHKRAKSEYGKAKKVLEVITSQLSEEMRQTYLNKPEIKQFYIDFEKNTSRKK